MAKRGSTERAMGRWLGVLAAGVLLAALVGSGPPAAVAQRSQFVQSFEWSPRIRGQLAKLDVLEKQKLWDEWLATYQGLVDENPEAVIPRDKNPEALVPAEPDDEFLDGLRFKLGGLFGRVAAREKPANLKQRYRTRFDRDAKKLYDQAAAAGDGRQMREVISRYRPSSAAARALAWLGSRALDDGNAETARIAFSRAVAEGQAEPVLLLKYALAAQAAGRTAEAKSILERVRKESPDAPVKLAGKPARAAAAAQELLDQLAARPVSADLWPNFPGPGGRRQMPGSLAARWGKVWEYVYPVPGAANSTTANRQRLILQGVGGSPWVRYGFFSFPVVDRDRVYMQGQKDLAALSLADGQVAWSNDDFVLSTGDGGGKQIFPRSAPPRSRNSQSAPSLSGGLLAVRMGVLMGDRANNNLRATGDFWLSVVNARTGQQLWKKTPDGAASFYNLPAIWDNVVFSGVTTSQAGITEYRAVALEAGTGDQLWSTYLGSGSDSMSGADGSPPVVRDGVVWIETSLHTLSGVDMLTGEIRTVYKYTPQTRGAGLGFEVPSPPNNPISLLPAVGPLVFSSRWGDRVVAIDPASGKLLWDTPKNGANSLFAVDNQRAYLWGQRQVMAVDLPKEPTGGKPSWDFAWMLPETSSASLGYAALVGDQIAVVAGTTLYTIDPATGTTTSTLELAEELGEGSGSTTILAVGNRLLIGTREKLVAFAPGG